jgi:hypothetical protein
LGPADDGAVCCSRANSEPNSAAEPIVKLMNPSERHCELTREGPGMVETSDGFEPMEEKGRCARLGVGRELGFVIDESDGQN